MEVVSGFLDIIWNMLSSNPVIMWIVIGIILLTIASLIIRHINGKKQKVEKESLPVPLKSAEAPFIPEGFYWCGKCNRPHDPNKNIGKQHLEGLAYLLLVVGVSLIFQLIMEFGRDSSHTAPV